MTKWLPLETARLLLREYRESDLDDVHEYGKDPEVARFMPWGPNTPAMTRQFLDEQLEEQREWPRPAYSAAIQLKSSFHAIGGVRLTVDGRSAELGYVLSRLHWGRGYVPEAARAMLNMAFGPLDLHRVWATCDVRNTGSYRVMEKLGMRREGRFEKDVFQKNEWRTSYIYAILDEEWLSARTLIRSTGTA